MAPIPVLDASVPKIKGLKKSNKAKIGACDKAILS